MELEALVQQHFTIGGKCFNTWTDAFNWGCDYLPPHINPRSRIEYCDNTKSTCTMP